MGESKRGLGREVPAGASSRRLCEWSEERRRDIPPFLMSVFFGGPGAHTLRSREEEEPGLERKDEHNTSFIYFSLYNTPPCILIQHAGSLNKLCVFVGVGRMDNNDSETGFL